MLCALKPCMTVHDIWWCLPYTASMATENDAATQQNVQEEKPNVQALQITVRAQDGSEVQFKIKQSTSLLKVFTAYCSKKGLKTQECRFMYEGQRVKGDYTPEQLQMEDGDLMDMVMEQQGGYSRSQ